MNELNIRSSKPRRRFWQITRRFLLWALVLLLCVGGMVMMHLWRAMGQNPQGEEQQRMAQSTAYIEGRFRNELGTQQQVMKAMGQMLNGKQIRIPEQPMHIEMRHRDDFEAELGEDVRITWMGHSSMLIEMEGKRVLTDPVWGPTAFPSPLMGPKRFHQVPIELEDLPRLDAVVISHDHYDHLDYPSVLRLIDMDVSFYVPLGVGSHLRYWGVPDARIHECDWWDEVSLDQLRLVFTPARHFSGRSLKRDQTLWGGWALIGSEKRVYFSGDSGMFPGFREIGERLGPFDITLMESGAYNAAWPDVHMGPEQAVLAHQMVRGKLLVPVHWGTFNLAVHAWTEPAERILEAAAKAGVDVYIPRQGEMVQSSQVPEQQRWWPDVPWESAENHPVVSSSLPEDIHLIPEF